MTTGLSPYRSPSFTSLDGCPGFAFRLFPELYSSSDRPGALEISGSGESSDEVAKMDGGGRTGTGEEESCGAVSENEAAPE